MLTLPVDWTVFQTVLCVGAHCDDIEIGCGGLLQVLQSRQPGLRVRWLVMSGEEERAGETRAAARALLPEVQALTVEVLNFRGSFLPQSWADIKDQFETLKGAVQPDLILTHRLEDMHQDHRVVGELTWNTFRDHLVLEYEIPKYEGDLGHPNVYVPLPSAIAERKIEVLMSNFPSQRSRTWFRPEVFRGLMQIRGIECNSPSGYAEAFHARKLVL